MRIFLLVIMISIAAIVSCHAQTMTFGEASGNPGDSISFSLSINPELPVTNFECYFTYDTNLLILDGISLSDGAEDNGIYRLWYDEVATGKIHVYTESWWDDWDWWVGDISRLAILEFKISSSAPSSTTYVSFDGSPQYELDYSGTMEVADSIINGVITIGGGGPAPTPTPPQGKSPEVALRMENTEVLTYGEEALVHYTLTANAWKGYSVDAYLAAMLPNGQIYYRDSRGDLTLSRVPVKSSMKLANAQGVISFGYLPSTIPEGLYNIYGTLTYVGKNPLNSSDRVSNLEDAQFELIASTPTPAPTPTPTPTVTSTPLP